MTLDFSSTLIDALRAEAKIAYPRECCGLIICGAEGLTEIIQTSNIHPSPSTHFEIDPVALIAAHKAEREDGAKIVGYYHSHPNGPPEPSDTDQSMAAGDGKIWAIIGQNGAEQLVKFWRDAPKGFEPLSL